MGFLKFEGVKISGISVCIPEQVVNNLESGLSIFSEVELRKTIGSIGVTMRHVAPPGICTSDLCFEAASSLLGELQVNRDEIDAVIFLSQTPDYRLPATACILQDRLGLGKKTIAFDVNLGCSGYIYGLSIAFSLINHISVSKVLLLVGDTSSKFVSALDKSSALLFGDAGTATLIESSKESKPVFCSLNSDGSGAKSLLIEGGGYRNQSSNATLIFAEQADKNIRSLENLFMDGCEIFNFTLREIPKDIQELLVYAGKTTEGVDLFFFHQANKFMIDFLAKKLKIPCDKYPLSLGTFGNTSSASIPLTIANSRESFGSGPKNIVLSGFGVGLSWGSMLIEIDGCKLLPIKTI
jgi:3-oxoacyl-[acyl-carrier-protein] synthase III